MSTAQEEPFQLRSLIVPAVLPTLMFNLGEGAIIPIIPSAAEHLGASLAVAGVVGAMITVGQLIGDLPSGAVVARFGERRVMIAAAALALFGVTIALIAPNPWILAAGVLCVGSAAAAFQLARLAFLTSFVPLHYRARALSSLGGASRFGQFVGPFVAAAVIAGTGRVQSVFLVQVVFAILTGVILLFLPDPADVLARRRAGAAAMTPRMEGAGRASVESRPEITASSAGLFQTVWRNRAVLLRLGTAAAMVNAMRASRQVLLPLWAVSIGVPPAQAALVIGIASAIDFALFYTSGQIMDRFGFLWCAVPALGGLAAAHFLLAATHGLPSATTWFIVGALSMGLANGVGSGIVMTLGANLTDQRNPAPFLGAWRFTVDAGAASAPLLLSGITGLLSIALGAVAMGVLGLLGTVLMIRYVPRYALSHPRRRTTSEAPPPG